jgi:1,4-dihydroxy-2-naphthoate octaprenyltransferase
MILWLVATTIFAFLVDFESDKQTGDKNLIIILGKKTSLFLLNFIYLVLSFLVWDRKIIFVGIFVIWFLTLFLWKFKSVQIWQKLYHLHLFIIILILSIFLILKLIS